LHVIEWVDILLPFSSPCLVEVLVCGFLPHVIEWVDIDLLPFSSTCLEEVFDGKKGKQ